MKLNHLLRYLPKDRTFLLLIPAVVFSAISMLSFVMGLAFGQEGQDGDVATWVGIALAVSMFILQVVGNSTDKGSMGPFLYISWIASYVIGATTSAFMIEQWVGIPNIYVSWTVSICLGIMVEILPERLFVHVYRSYNKGHKSQFSERRETSKPPGENDKNAVDHLRLRRQGVGYGAKGQASHIDETRRMQRAPQSDSGRDGDDNRWMNLEPTYRDPTPRG